MSSRGTRSKKPSTRQSAAAIKHAFPDLREKHGTVENLEDYLKTLDAPTLRALILNGAFPEASSGLRHCIYCHKTFNTETNNDGCSVKHFRETSYEEDAERKLCCGKDMEDVDWDEGMETMEDLYPYCYQGRHWEKEIMTDDENELGEEALGMNDEQGGGLLPVVWWREWRKDGRTCEKKQCANKPTKRRR